MSASASICIPARTGRIGSDVLNAVVAIVRNRTQQDYTLAFNQVTKANPDLLNSSYDNLDAARNFSRLLNREEQRTGSSLSDCIEHSAARIAALANRFAPAFATAPAATQWDILWRAASSLDKAGLPQRIYNRAAANEPSKADLESANSKAADALAWLDDQTTAKAGDIGRWLQDMNYSPKFVWRCFYFQVQRLMRENALTCEQAFARLKEEQPLFWVLAMLSFNPEET